jgi:phosphoenolpyruvate synthase/pyruvate phosphate dikinase
MAAVSKCHGFHDPGPDSSPGELLFMLAMAQTMSSSIQFSPAELEQIAGLNGALVEAYGEEGVASKHMAALRYYLETMAFMGRRFRMFEIANHRIFLQQSHLIVPYDAHGNLLIYALEQDSIQLLQELRLPHGTLVTDKLITTLVGKTDRLIDLEKEIYHLEIDDTPSIQVTRLRDLARLLNRLNSCGSRHEAVYLLRFLVARLCSTSSRGISHAKNLKPEIMQVRKELVEFMNGPFAHHLRLPTRLLVRNISGLVAQPKLIDEVWQDTIDLCEVHVRGSTITNEIRRSTHHAMGRNTLGLARAYLHWLRTGEAAFPDPEREVPTAADEEARSSSVVKDLVARIVRDLEQLLGNTQIVSRMAEWRSVYATELISCESGNTLDEELESLIANGIQANNRWVYQHRLRSLLAKAGEGAWQKIIGREFQDQLEHLQQVLPGDDGFQGDQAEQLAREAVSGFACGLRRNHQDALFAALDRLVAQYQADEQFGTFNDSCSLRRELENLAGEGTFTSQRYLLHQLDCVLEELGFFALRHVASGYLENGVDLKECLTIIFLCARNLERDGLFSRELWDLSVMLMNPGRTPTELLDVLKQIQQNYHRLVLRVSEAYDVMAEHLGYSADEMRAVQGNFQRTMHDLNNLVHFSDLARAHITDHQMQNDDPGEGAKGNDPWDFVHLSHIEDITRRVEDLSAVSLQARYGGKGCGLIYISYLGIPTRDAFIIPTVLPRSDLHLTERERLEREILGHVQILEKDISLNDGEAVRLGDPDAPLLLAVRGGSVFSMPGMLSTIVFVGMTDAVAEALAGEDEWFAWDSYRRFLASYAAAVWQLDLEELDLVEKAKCRYGVGLKTDLPGTAMHEVVEASKLAIHEAGHGEQLDLILNDTELQLITAVCAVHKSWDAERACRYRDIKHMSNSWHTAVIVQQMACGNRSNKEELKPGMDEMCISLTGVIPNTRMTTSGVRVFTGDVKFSACGDDLVGGLTAAKSFEPVEELRAQAPMLERKLNHVSARLRRYLGSDTEIEFTVERGVLSILQTRSAQAEQHYNPRTFKDPGSADGQGIGISGGAFRGVVAFDEDDVGRLSQSSAVEQKEVDGILLLLENPIPDEIPLILSVDGLLCAKGGSTSHAAVAVHGIDDKPYTAVLGVSELRLSGNAAELVRPDGRSSHLIHAGDVVSIHGQTGEVFAGTRDVLSVAEEK